MRISIVQINLTPGNIIKNTDTILNACSISEREKCDLVITAEMSISGYNVKDLILNREFLRQNQQYLEKIIQTNKSYKHSLILGHISDQTKQKKISSSAVNLYDSSKKSLNLVSFIRRGWIEHQYIKRELPNYDVHDEERYFISGEKFDLPIKIINYGEIKIGLLICADMWRLDIVEKYVQQNADVIVVVNGSPFSLEKKEKRYNMAKLIADKYQIMVIYVNQVGGQDNILFDGSSFIINSDGSYGLKPCSWFEGLIKVKIFKNLHGLMEVKQDDIVYLEQSSSFVSNQGSSEITSYNKILHELSSQNQDYHLDLYCGLMMGLRDYVLKNKFHKVIIGLSGGIDSAFVATLACDALGPENVLCLFLPSIHSSNESEEDAKSLCHNLNCEIKIFSIIDIHKIVQRELNNSLTINSFDITYDNIQARIRGMILMAFSNKNNMLLLSCSNKSEIAIGYSTIYGDTCGGFAPIGDIYKTTLYQLGYLRNSIVAFDQAISSSPIPLRILTKQPTAELHPGQLDQDDLPPYEVLDKILYFIIEKDQYNIDEIALQTLCERSLIKKIYNIYRKQEFKRQQLPPFTKVSQRTLRDGAKHCIISDFFF